MHYNNIKHRHIQNLPNGQFGRVEYNCLRANSDFGGYLVGPWYTTNELDPMKW